MLENFRLPELEKTNVFLYNFLINKDILNQTVMLTQEKDNYTNISW